MHIIWRDKPVNPPSNPDTEAVRADIYSLLSDLRRDIGRVEMKLNRHLSKSPSADVEAPVEDVVVRLKRASLAGSNHNVD